MLLLSLCTAGLVAFLTYCYKVLAQFQAPSPLNARNVLLLTAHPDDECMFFGPTIAALRATPKTKIHVLCLSTGNADGLGSIRKKELSRSCQVFGIAPSNVKAIDRPELQDGMRVHWPAVVIADVVRDYVEKNNVDTLITFDDYGVSGHPNHIAVYNGAKHYVTSNKKVRLYSLASISLLRKYVGAADLIPLSVLKWVTSKLHENRTQPTLFVSSPGTYLMTHKAMRQHTSQLVWFRWLYVTFSRYMFINELVLVQ